MIIESKKNLNEKTKELFYILEHMIAGSRAYISDKEASDKSMVIAINGKYGSGKTTFLDFFIQHIQSSDKDKPRRTAGNVHCYGFQRNATASFSSVKDGTSKNVIFIKYDAWKNDDFDDPFVSLVGQICFSYGIDSPEIEGFLSASKEIGKILGKIIGKTISEIDVLGISAGTTIEGFKELIDKMNEKKFDEQVFAYQKLENNKLKFKEALSNLGMKDNDNPLKIILVDELDRCNPSFAIKLLERIKHFFCAENTIFIIALDKNQFISIIKKVYGNDFDAEHYLSRFFDFEIQLPVDEDFKTNLFYKYFGSDHSDLALEIVKFYDMQPREMIKYSRLLRFLKTTNRGWGGDVYYLLAGLKIMRPLQITEIKNFRIDFSQPLDHNIENLLKKLNLADKLGYSSSGKNTKPEDDRMLIILLNLLFLIGRYNGKASEIKDYFNNTRLPNNIIKNSNQLNMDENYALSGEDFERLVNFFAHFNW